MIAWSMHMSMWVSNAWAIAIITAIIIITYLSHCNCPQCRLATLQLANRNAANRDYGQSQYEQIGATRSCIKMRQPL